MLEFIHVMKNFKKNNSDSLVLKDLNLKINEGEIFGVIGKSGAGKSTLLRCMNLLERPSSGQVLFQNKNILNLNEEDLRFVRRKIGMIFQNFNLLSQATVFENVALPLTSAGLQKDEIFKRVEELLELVGLSEKSKYYPDELSGGQKQRVAIARALANKPSVLLCDEATSALDVENSKSILNLLKKINQDLNVTIVFITHQIDVIKSICHRVGILDSGSLVEVSEKDQFFKSPTSKQGQLFLQIHSFENEVCA
jgi:D-methionine transport system ATP-binding protein